MFFGDSDNINCFSNFFFNMSSNIKKVMNENQNETENKMKMQCNYIDERKKRYLE